MHSNLIYVQTCTVKTVRHYYGFQDDAKFGLRLAFNDLRDSTLLAGWFQDRQSPAKIIQLEAGRRIGEQFKLSLELRVILDLPENDQLHSLRNDDHLKLAFTYYF